ncbi:MAG: heavy metal translocating P-type ATPase, partial [Candidatus Bathyarchaeia archaeon]
MQHQHHAHHIQEFKNKFWISLILTAPILLLSEMMQTWFPILQALQIPFKKEILLFLSLIVYLYGGWPFLKGLADEVKARQPGMMTLI